MICFLDRTFCSASDMCKETKCFRNFTSELKAESEEWWKDCEGSPPVAWSDFSDTCPAYNPKDE